LHSYVEAMGGRLRLTIEFPDKAPVSLERLGDAEEPRPRHHAWAHRPAIPEETGRIILSNELNAGAWKASREAEKVPERVSRRKALAALSRGGDAG